MHQRLISTVAPHQVVKGCAWSDGGSEFVFGDGTVLAFRDEMNTLVALPPPSSSIPASKEMMCTSWALSAYCEKVAQALRLYNRYTSHPRLISSLLAADDDTVVVDDVSSASSRHLVSCSTLLMRDFDLMEKRQAVAYLSDISETESCGRGRVARVGSEWTLWCVRRQVSLTIHYHGKLFTVRWPATMCGDAGDGERGAEDNGGSSRVYVVEQVFPVEAPPPEWKAMLDLALEMSRASDAWEGEGEAPKPSTGPVYTLHLPRIACSTARTPLRFSPIDISHRAALLAAPDVALASCQDVLHAPPHASASPCRLLWQWTSAAEVYGGSPGMETLCWPLVGAEEVRVLAVIRGDESTLSVRPLGGSRHSLGFQVDYERIDRQTKTYYVERPEDVSPTATSPSAWVCEEAPHPHAPRSLCFTSVMTAPQNMEEKVAASVPPPSPVHPRDVLRLSSIPPAALAGGDVGWGTLGSDEKPIRSAFAQRSAWMFSAINDVASRPVRAPSPCQSSYSSAVSNTDFSSMIHRVISLLAAERSRLYPTHPTRASLSVSRTQQDEEERVEMAGTRKWWENHTRGVWSPSADIATSSSSLGTGGDAESGADTVCRLPRRSEEIRQADLAAGGRSHTRTHRSPASPARAFAAHHSVCLARSGEVLACTQVEGVGVFTAWVSGAVRCRFLDRVVVTVSPLMLEDDGVDARCRCSGESEEGCACVDVLCQRYAGSEDSLVARCLLRDASVTSLRVLRCGPSHQVFRYVKHVMDFRRQLTSELLEGRREREAGAANVAQEICAAHGVDKKHADGLMPTPSQPPPLSAATQECNDIMFPRKQALRGVEVDVSIHGSSAGGETRNQSLNNSRVSWSPSPRKPAGYQTGDEAYPFFHPDVEGEQQGTKKAIQECGEGGLDLEDTVLTHSDTSSDAKVEDHLTRVERVLRENRKLREENARLLSRVGAASHT